VGVRAEIREFFERFGRAGDGADPAGLAGCFAERFLALDPGTAAPVERGALIAALPARRRLFASIGAAGTDLAGLDETPLDEMHTLAETTWRVRFDEPREPLLLRSAFLLRREPAGWRIVVYLNHDDLAATIAARGGEAG
jgi:hypothetical protein